MDPKLLDGLTHEQVTEGIRKVADEIGWSPMLVAAGVAAHASVDLYRHWDEKVRPLLAGPGPQPAV